MRAILLVTVLACSGCHACVAALLAEDDPTSEGPAATTTATATAAPPEPAPPSESPDPPDPAPRPSGGNAGGAAGRYECFQIRVTIGSSGMFQTTWVPGAISGFTIDPSGGYVSSGKPGVVLATAQDIRFIGGPYDGWRGALGTNSTGFHVRFRGSSPGDPKVGDSAKSGDYQCYRQKS